MALNSSLSLNTGLLNLGMKQLSVRMRFNSPKSPYKIQSFSPNFLTRKQTVSADFRANRPNIYRNCPFAENFLTRKLGGKTYSLCRDTTKIYQLFFLEAPGNSLRMIKHK